MLKHTVEVVCDVCLKTVKTYEAGTQGKQSITLENDLFNVDKIEDIPVIFTTNQTDGYPCEPYLSIYSLHLCDSCKRKLLEGNAIFASGVQGYNDYWFKDKKEKTKCLIQKK